jgi:RIO kinase 1
MFHICKLVHADLSEYNILYHNGHLWIIDVSQSVEHDHPSAFDFLRNDIKNVEEFFGRFGVKCLGLRRCFEFTTKEKLSGVEGESEEDALRRWLEDDPVGETAEDGMIAAADDLTVSDPMSHSNQLDNSTKGTEDQAHENSVFLHSFIPRTLNEVYDPERDVEKLKRGDDLIYADTIGLVLVGRDEGLIPDDEVENGDSATDEGESDEMVEKTPRGHRHEDRDAKKVQFA